MLKKAGDKGPGRGGSTVQVTAIRRGLVGQLWTGRRSPFVNPGLDAVLQNERTVSMLA